MKYTMIFVKDAIALLLLVLAMIGLHARAQNQTPANVAPPVGWTDLATGLTWTKQDNGSDVTWDQANAYCSNLRMGGYSDWRLPTIDELQGIYVPGQFGEGATTKHVKGNLKLSSGSQWSSTRGSAHGEAWFLSFFSGKRYSRQLGYGLARALCVRRSGE